ncbi:uncharacterized protein LOC119974531 isoform X2 [Scyliorhinus canicula]|uniref:uncharacterized protein LOC119974531 isoform X2 n=1 Tax=Scyliorhinus canicula TaxID=7830 RepID=UPI0018F4529E|nr:uncharacterized protein LOC119974531 isoform X2 [Scyliorhinus canicula]
MRQVECQDLTISVNESLVNAAVEDLVLLSVRPSIQVKSGNWKHNGMDVINWIGTAVDINYQYADQVELVHDVSLLLKSVTVSDSGEYIVTMNPHSGAEGKARIHLVVFEPISTVYITSNDSNTVRENASVCLTCHVVGNWTKIIWSFNGSVVNSNERKILASGNSTLTIISVNAINVGEYQCVARSPVSEKASELYSLHIGTTSDFNDGMLKWAILLAVFIPFLLIFCTILTKIKTHCCDRQCSCSFLSRYIFYYWVSCCNKNALENICDNQEIGRLKGAWVACCSSRSKEECDSPCVEEPRTLSGLSISCCSSVLHHRSEFQKETERGKHSGILLSCCSSRSPDESEWIRSCCCPWLSCCKAGLNGNVEASNYRGLWISCCDCGFKKDEQESQEHIGNREFCDCWIACCNKGSEDSIEIYANPITSTTGQQQSRHFSWTSTASTPAAGEAAPTEMNKELGITKSTAKEFPEYAVVDKKNKLGNDTVDNRKNPPIAKPIEYAVLQHPEAGSNTRNATSSRKEVDYGTLKF